LERKSDQTETARPEGGLASSSSGQPAHGAVAQAFTHASAPHSRSPDRVATETAAAPEAIAPVDDTAQGGAGGLDQFSTGASHEGAAGRPEIGHRAQTAQADFKALLAASDAPAEPSRAAQIATVHLERAAASRSTDALTIQLEPVDLGKIEVRLDFGSEGRVQASIVAENTETLDLLQRDSRSLERALQSAGLQTDAGSLNFSLRGDSRSGREFGQRSFKGNALSGQELDSTEIQIVAARPSLGAAGRVDIRI
jgi:flagellar hook-length control protein FliK